MKKALFIIVLALCANFSFAQDAVITLAAAKNEVSVKESSTKIFKMNFSFDKIESYNVAKDDVNFSHLVIESLSASGDFGSPQLPKFSKFIIVPNSANVKVNVKNYSETEFYLPDYQINKIYPHQPSIPKNVRIEDVVFQYNELIYTKNAFVQKPLAEVKQAGVMRGLNIATLEINPIAYNPVTNTIKVFNNIEVEVEFENADLAEMKKMYEAGINPYFEDIYSIPINSNILKSGQTRDLYDTHDDFYHTPVRMLVIAHNSFEAGLQNWLRWKREKGFYVDVHYTSETGTTVANIKNFIYNKYNQSVTSGNAYTFLVLVGDFPQIPAQSVTEQGESFVTDLWYASVDGDIFPEMYHSRISVETTAELNNFVEKLLYYEKYEIADPSYLNNALLIAGKDATWNPREAQPTIRYATNFHFNAANGFDNVYAYYTTYSGCYNNFNTGVGFANYTAHGSETSWADPEFNTTNAANLTNTNKYFWAVGNCCVTGAFNYSSKCFAEALIRGQQRGAFAYVGSVPVTFWGADIYWSMGYYVNGFSPPTNYTHNPSFQDTKGGMYEYLFNDNKFNAISSLMFVGNIAVLQQKGNNDGRYYFQAYHTFGDGSVIPYRIQPTANNVTCQSVIPLGSAQFSLTADPLSYAAISKDGDLLGVGYADNLGNITVNFDTPISEMGEYLLVVTAPQKIPYFQTINALTPNTPYIILEGQSFDGDGILSFGKTSKINIDLKNVGVQPTGNLTLTLTCSDPNISITNPTVSTNAILADGLCNIQDAFELIVSPNIENGHIFNFNLEISDQSNQWSARFNATAYKPVLKVEKYSFASNTAENELLLSVKVKNTGGYKASNMINNLVPNNSGIEVLNSQFAINELLPNATKEAIFIVNSQTVSTSQSTHNFNFTANSDNGLVTCSDDIQYSRDCGIKIILMDSYGDGWEKGQKLIISFSDGTPSKTITFSEKASQKEVIIFVAPGTTVTVVWNSGTSSGTYDYECSYRLEYLDGALIYQSQGTPQNNQTYGFVSNCNSLPQGTCNSNYALTVSEVNIEQDDAIVNLSWNIVGGSAANAFKVLRDDEFIALVGNTDNFQDIVFDFEYNVNYNYCIVPMCAFGLYSDESFCADVSIIEEKITDVFNNDIQIYPNPVKNELRIKSEELRINNVEILDITGKMLDTHYSLLDTHYLILNTNSLSQGIYLVKIYTNEGVFVKRIIKK